MAAEGGSGLYSSYLSVCVRWSRVGGVCWGEGRLCAHCLGSHQGTELGLDGGFGSGSR